MPDLRRPLAALAMLAGALGAGAALAQDEEDLPPAVSARQGQMHLYAQALGTLGGMAKGEIDYDAAMAQAAAERIAQISAMNQDGLWPEGTSTEEVEGSRALPAIWENREDFLSGFEDLHQAAMEMQDAAGESAEAIGAQMRAIGQDGCGGCHDDYRESED